LVWSWSGLIFALLVGLVVALVFGGIGGLTLRWLPGLLGGSLFEVVDFLKTQQGFGKAMLIFGLIGGLAGFSARIRGQVHVSNRRLVRRTVSSWQGLIFALLVGIIVGLVLGSIFFNHLSWIASQFGFAGGWELVFALVMGVLGGVVSGVAGFAATLGGLVHDSVKGS